MHNKNGSTNSIFWQNIHPCYVFALRIHLENQQQVIFNEGEEEIMMETQRDTELTAFFNYNATHPEEEPEEYVNFPKKHVYNKNTKKWNLRKGNTFSIGRIHSVNPLAGDIFYMRILLHQEHCKGKISFTDLRTISNENVPCDTYKEVCRKLGLLQDDQEWSNALSNAAEYKMCPQLRNRGVYFECNLLQGEGKIMFTD